VVQTAANKGVLLALVAMGQTFVVLTAGIDLSVGMIFILCNCLASYVVGGSPTMVALGIVTVIAAGLLCGAVNGAIVIFGRLQPIVATIASGAVFFGLALWLRPSPGASAAFSGDIADFMTGKILGIVPSSGVFLAVIVLCVWIPFRRSPLGRAVYATGSSESAAFMSGVPTYFRASSRPSAASS
jgi:ribose transport system permease protein